MRQYLDIPSGEPTTDLIAMVLEGLRSKLRGLIRKVLQDGNASSVVATRVWRNGHVVAVRITVEPLPQPKGRDMLLLVSFFDESPQPGRQKALPAPADAASEENASGDAGATPADSEPAEEVEREADGDDTDPAQDLRQLEYELQATREDLQSTIEELETLNEELNASNEEVMSMNEELQSSNEELETSREELQSLNEELSTVNSQLEEKVKELESTNNDLDNLLTSTEIATLFLDSEFRIRRFTPAARELFNLITTDVGRPISDLAPRVNDPHLLNDARSVLQKLTPIEREVGFGAPGSRSESRQDFRRSSEPKLLTSSATPDTDSDLQDVPNEDDDPLRWFIRRMLPYRTSDNVIDGVVLTLTDVTTRQLAMRRLEMRERQQAAVARLGQLALTTDDLQPLFEQAVREIVDTVGTEMCKVLQLLPGRRSLLLRAGIGWQDGLVGAGTVGAGLDSQAGYTLQSAGPVIVRDLRTEKRFSGPPLLHDHNVVSGMSVLIGSPEKPWGVLGAHTTREMEFNVDDVHFLEAVANCLTTAIQVAEAEASLRQAFESVEQSQQQLQAITSAMPGLIALVDNEQRFEFINAACEEYFQQSREDILGKTMAEVLGERLYRNSRPQMKQALSGEIVRFEKEFEFAERGRVPTMVHYVPRTDRNGDVTGVYALITDVSEVKEKQQQILDWKNRYETALTASGQMLYDWDPNTDTVTWGGNTRRVLGFNRNEMGERLNWWLKRIHPDDRPTFREQLLDQVPDSPLVRLQYRVCHKDGHYVPVEDRGDFINPPKGRIARAIGFVEDVTDRRIAEQARARLAAIVESSDDGIFSIDANGLVVSWNHGAERLFGTTADEATGETYESILPEESRNQIAENFDRVLSGESVTGLRADVQRDGQTINIAVTLSPLRGSNETITGISAISRDIRDRIQRETDEAMLRASEEERRRIGQDLHDGLGQELTGLSMLAQTLADKLSEERAATEATRIAAGIRDAQSNIRQIARGLVPVELDAQGLMAALEDLAERTSEVSDIECRFECPEAVVVSHNDLATNLYRIAQEAVTNAVRHASACQITIHLQTLEADPSDSTTDTPPGRQIVLTVEDDGCGMDLENLESGNGLRIMRHRAERLSGTFELCPSNNGGTRITCRVPAE